MRESNEKGLISHLAAFAAGAASGPNHHHGYPSHHGCPPQGYSHHGYPPQGYPTGGCPPQGYPTSRYPPASYPPTYAYPPPSYYGSNHGHGGMSGSLLGGAAAAATAYGAHRLWHGHHGTFSGYGHGHGHGKFKHGKFKKYGFYGKHKHFGSWK